MIKRRFSSPRSSSKVQAKSRVLIEDTNTSQNVNITFELSLKLSNDMFESLYAHAKNKCEVELMKKKEPMAQTYEFVKEICDAFAEIRFDGVKMCFYNENEEIAKWNLQEDAEGTGEGGKKPKRDGCDCCVTL